MYDNILNKMLATECSSAWKKIHCDQEVNIPEFNLVQSWKEKKTYRCNLPQDKQEKL